MTIAEGRYDPTGSQDVRAEAHHRRQVEPGSVTSRCLDGAHRGIPAGNHETPSVQQQQCAGADDES